MHQYFNLDFTTISIIYFWCSTISRVGCKPRFTTELGHQDTIDSLRLRCLGLIWSMVVVLGESLDSQNNNLTWLGVVTLILLHLSCFSFIFFEIEFLSLDHIYRHFTLSYRSLQLIRYDHLHVRMLINVSSITEVRWHYGMWDTPHSYHGFLHDNG